MTEYGLCLWTFGDIDFEEKCKIAQSIGVDGVEVQGNLEDDPKKIKETLSTYGLKPLSITPADVDIASLDKKVRRDAVDYYLKLIDWAQELGVSRFCLHGEVGRINWDGSLTEHWNLLVDSTKEIMEKSEKADLEVVYEVLNRYENYQVLTAEEGLKLISDVKSDKLKLLLDAYHMNIEESDPAKALVEAGNNLGVYHVADSNRQAVGNGNTDFDSQFKALHSFGYAGPVIMEISAAGPNPFTPEKGEGYLEQVVGYYNKSLEILKKNFN